MTHDPRFALIDTDGDERFAAIIDGTFQIGKAKNDTPTDIGKFAHAILVDGRGGRFVCIDGQKPAVLKFIGRPRSVVGYRLDPQIAAKLGIPPERIEVISRSVRDVATTPSPHRTTSHDPAEPLPVRPSQRSQDRGDRPGISGKSVHPNRCRIDSLPQSRSRSVHT